MKGIGNAQTKVVPKKFKHRQSLNTHMKLCGTGKIISCKLWLKTFCRDWHCREHKCKGKPPSKHACNVCGKEFKTAYHLNRHLPVHNESTSISYTFSTCSKKYVRKKQFHIHVKDCVSTKTRTKRSKTQLHENDDTLTEMDMHFNKNDDDDDSFIPTFVALDRDEPSGSVGSMEPFDIDECEHDSATSTITPTLSVQTTPKARRFQKRKFLSVQPTIPQSTDDNEYLLLSPPIGPSLNSHPPDFNSTLQDPIINSPVNSHSNTSTNNTN